MKVLRRKSGRLLYWGLGVVLSVGMFAVQFKLLAIGYFSLVLLVGIFAELEELGLSLNVSSFFTLVINSLIWAGVCAAWISTIGSKWSSIVLTQLETFLKPLETYNPGLQLNYFDLLLQMPSVLLMTWMAALYLAILLESRMLRAEQPGLELPMRGQLKEFRVPDAAVWMFILALLGKFGGFSNQAVEAFSANCLNVCFMLFFFQGIAVISRSFEKIRMGLLWQTLFMVLIVVYLFLFVSILGLMDYWFDFRARLAKGGSTGEFENEM